MKLEHIIRLIAGSFILVSLILGHLVSPYWYLFTAFVGINLIQSAITKWCLMEDILKGIGLGDDSRSSLSGKPKAANS